MAKIERSYVVPLRKEFMKAPLTRRAKKATIALRNFLVKHMKSENVKIGQFLNEVIWSRGMKNPPSKVEVDVTKDDEGVVYAELKGVEKQTVAKKEKKAETKTEKKTDSVEAKPKTAEKKTEPKSEEKAEKKATKAAPKKAAKSSAKKAE